MESKPKAILYCRVSSKEQEESGYSLDSQEKLLTEYADEKGFEIAPHVFKVSESASGKQIRKTFTEMLEYAEKQNINIILCEKTDRLTRNLKDAATASDWIQEDETRQIHFVKEHSVVSKNTKAHENFVWDMKVAVARFYTNNLSEEVKKGQKEKLAQGWRPSRPPLGYMTTGEKGHRTHIPDPKTAPFMIRAFNLYATSKYSIKALADQLYHEGLRSPSGNRLVKSRLDDMLRDPFYCGLLRWNDVIQGVGKHEPLISKGLFDEVQAILTGRKAPHFKRRSFTFRKMFDCGECGGTITAEIKKGRYIYYRCFHYHPCSQKGGTREEELEKQLLGAFDFFENITKEEAEQIRLKIKQNHAQEVAYKEKARSELQARYDALGRRKERLYEDRLDEHISVEYWKKKEKEIDEERTGILESLDRIQSKEAKYYELWQNILDLAFRAKEIYLKRSPEQRRALLLNIFSNLLLKDGKLTYKLKEPVEKLAERIQQKLDIKITFTPGKTYVLLGKMDSFDLYVQAQRDAEKSLEPTQKAAKGGSLRGASVNNTTPDCVESLEPRKHFRTSKNPDSTVRFGDSDSKSGSLLAWQTAFRTFPWAEALGDPELVIRQVRELMSLV